MAARLNRLHQESVKTKIQGTQLLKRLQDHALGELDLSTSQIDCAKFLLNKIISNAPIENITELSGSVDSSIKVEFVKP